MIYVGPRQHAVDYQGVQIEHWCPYDTYQIRCQRFPRSWRPFFAGGHDAGGAAVVVPLDV